MVERIQVHVGELRQLFNSIDPSPFRERDLDPNAEIFILAWARDASRATAFELHVHTDQTVTPAVAAEAQTAVQSFFRQRAIVTRSRLRQTFRVGRTSLLIGVIAIAVSIAAGGFVEDLFEGQRWAEILRESLIIGGWVAMWRPLETFLYDWWPIRDEARLFDRLAAMPVTFKANMKG
jgi:hypothetical protein